MSESSLTVAYNELQGRVGSYLGWGPGPLNGGTVWSAQQQFELTGLLKSGLRTFYFPAMPDNTVYDWSFLTPQAQLDLPSGASQITLPDDFGGFEGVLTLVTTSTQAWPWRVEWRNEGAIRTMYQLTPLETGAPMYAAVVPLKGTQTFAGQRFALLLFPTPDQEYTLGCTYHIHPDYLSGQFPYAYGGVEHSETLLEACLAAAERTLDDSLGVHAQTFQERLQASMAMDARKKPQKSGKNLDRSDGDDSRYGDWHWYNEGAVTYNDASFG